MAYQWKQRAYEQEPQQHVPQPQPSLFASPDLETEEADNAFSVDMSKPGPSMEVRLKPASHSKRLTILAVGRSIPPVALSSDDPSCR